MPTPKKPFHRRSATIERLSRATVAIQRLAWVWMALMLGGWSGGVWAEPHPTPQILRPLPWVQAVLVQPDQAPVLAREALHSARMSAQNPLLAWQTLAGWTLGAQAPSLGQTEVNGADPLPGALLRLVRASGSPVMAAPSKRQLPEPLRSAWAQQIDAVVVARHALDEALAGLDPKGLRLDDKLRAVLLRQALRGDFREGDAVDVRHWLGRIDHAALARGMAVLLQAADHLQRTLAQRAWPALVWQHRTPWGLVRLDTTRQSGQHLVQDPLLWVSVGGDDHYRFRPRSGQNPVSVFMDVRGNDTYISEHDGADPSVGFWAWACCGMGMAETSTTAPGWRRGPP